jgi:hypothetical protein
MYVSYRVQCALHTAHCTLCSAVLRSIEIATAGGARLIQGLVGPIAYCVQCTVQCTRLKMSMRCSLNGICLKISTYYAALRRNPLQGCTYIMAAKGWCKLVGQHLNHVRTKSLCPQYNLSSSGSAPGIYEIN